MYTLFYIKVVIFSVCVRAGHQVHMWKSGVDLGELVLCIHLTEAWPLVSAPLCAPGKLALGLLGSSPVSPSHGEMLELQVCATTACLSIGSSDQPEPLGLCG